MQFEKCHWSLVISTFLIPTLDFYQAIVTFSGDQWHFANEFYTDFRILKKEVVGHTHLSFLRCGWGNKHGFVQLLKLAFPFEFIKCVFREWKPLLKPRLRAKQKRVISAAGATIPSRRKQTQRA
jgi:hypothetical protein